MPDLERVSWFVDEPVVLERELAAMPSVAPELAWVDGHWEGVLPLWPFQRAEPPALLDFVGDRRFRVEVHYYESFPMVAPRFMPVEPQPEIAVWTMHRWHVMGDGSLCLFQNFTDWHPSNTAADLVPKAAGWFLEYLLIVDNAVEQMTVEGIARSDELDHLFVARGC